MSISKQLEEIVTYLGDEYCKYPCQPVPEGKDENWLLEDKDSPCLNCPLNDL